jgi:hypothetical protein
MYGNAGWQRIVIQVLVYVPVQSQLGVGETPGVESWSAIWTPSCNHELETLRPILRTEFRAFGHNRKLGSEVILVSYLM